MNLQEQISRMKSMMGVINEGDRVNKFKRIMSLGYPNFNKKGVTVLDSEGIKFIIDKNDDDLKYATYWSDDRELQLNKEIFNFLDNFTNEDIFDEAINWFNDEFGTDAEYVTF